MAMYAYLDGDDVGLKIEKSLLTNNETEQNQYRSKYCNS